MRKQLLLFSLLFPLILFSQKKEKQVTLAFTNSQSAYPFGSLSKLFSGPFHPGFEVGYGFNWKTKPKHDWYQAFRVGYFYHRFVQQGIPLYTQTGYRYKPWRQVHFNTALGLGYLHSIPGSAVLKANSDGEYENAKGIGRSQVLINLSLGTRYALSKKENAASVFLQYTQQLQAPFIKSYVPLLPYNNIALGFSMPFKK
jgi:hypothetical protein